MLEGEYTFGKVRDNRKTKLPKINSNKISFLNYERDVLIYMFRYCVTRQSYAVGTCIEIIESNWNIISIHDRTLIQKEIGEMLEWNKEMEVSWQKILKLPLDGVESNKYKI